jgi:DNA-binding MarR family transcriptional regulator
MNNMNNMNNLKSLRKVLNSTAYEILVAIDENPSANVTDISRIIGLPRSTVVWT